MKKLFVTITILAFTSLCLQASDPHDIILTTYPHEATIMLAQLLRLDTQASQAARIIRASSLAPIWSTRGSIFQEHLKNLAEDLEEKFILPDEEQRAIQAFHAFLKERGIADEKYTDSSGIILSGEKIMQKVD